MINYQIMSDVDFYTSNSIIQISKNHYPTVILASFKFKYKGSARWQYKSTKILTWKQYFFYMNMQDNSAKLFHIQRCKLHNSD